MSAKTTPTVTAEWRAAEMPGQYQALMALLFGGTGTAQQADAPHSLVARSDSIERRVSSLEADAQDVAA